MPTYILDQSSPTYDDPFDGITLRTTDVNTTKITQTFTCGATGAIGKVTIRLKKAGTITAGKNVWVEIFSTSSGVPSTLLSTSGTLEANTVSTGALGAEYDFIFTGGTTLNSGTKYAVVLAGDYTASGSNNVLLAWDYTGEAGPYENGEPGYYNGSSFTTPGWTGRDFEFYEYYEDASSGPAHIASINGVAIANIASKNGVALGNIKSINGVE